MMGGRQVNSVDRNGIDMDEWIVWPDFQIITPISKDSRHDEAIVLCLAHFLGSHTPGCKIRRAGGN